MWMSLLLFAISLFGWWGLLWLGLPVSWQRISPSAILLLHALPPVLIFAAVKGWLAGRKQRAAAAEEARKQAAEAERLAAVDAARQQHRQALAARRATVDCRWAGLLLQGAAAPGWFDGLADVGFARWVDADALQGDTLPARLTPLLHQWLAALYRQVPGAAALPLLLEPCAELAGAEQLQWVRSTQRAVLDELFDNAPQPEPPCRFLPGHGLLAGRLQRLFDAEPGQPGALVLAFDACWHDDANDDAPAVTPRAVVAGLLFLRANLPAEAPAAVPDAPADDSRYQPYWQQPVQHAWVEWGTVPGWAQQDLLVRPTLAALATAGDGPALPTGVLAMSKALQPQLETALIQAGLRDLPFGDDPRDPAYEQAHTLAWLVHNGGDLRGAAGRLAALGNLLSAHEAELSPIDDAISLVCDTGLGGSASDVLLDTCAALKAAQLGAPVLIARFTEQQTSVAVTRPPQQESTE